MERQDQLYEADGLAQLVVFLLDGQTYAIHLHVVDRVIPLVETASLPRAPSIVAGFINVQGKVIPVVNIRDRFGLLGREPLLSDHIIIARTSRRTIGVLVDSVTGVLKVASSKVVSARKILPNIEYVNGVVTLEDGMVLIHDLDTFLSLDEEQQLEAALKMEEVNK